MPDLETYQFKMSNFIEQFGHLSDNGNDFSSVPWREQPDMVMGLIIGFTSNETSRGQQFTYREIKSNPARRSLLYFFHRRAQEFRLLREQVSSLYTFGYGLFRYYFLALGARFMRRSILDEERDIFYLTRQEVLDCVAGRKAGSDFRERVATHKIEIERVRNIAMPAVIHGDVPPPLQNSSWEKLVGVPTSIGYYTGPVVIVRGIQDFAKVKTGDVLVIPYSDVGWTPLFARAGAIVAESGGLLSHSSIVAREYNIPAVVSVEGATRMPEGTIVTVNGHTGEVLFH